MQKIKPEALLAAYRKGRFPMAKSKDASSVTWHHPRRRGIIPIDSFHISKRYLRQMRKDNYTVGIDQQFRKVMECCADREWSWINDSILDVYTTLHEKGKAHSLELYDQNDGNKLVGGLYGVTMGGVFFSESIFHKAPNADKFAFFHCHQILKSNGFELWDHQLYTEHLAQFGCIRVWRWTFNRMLKKALKQEDRPFTLPETKVPVGSK
jgi:leucyl/phenylalanyl-tRNA--protein transferase